MSINITIFILNGERLGWGVSSFKFILPEKVMKKKQVKQTYIKVHGKEMHEKPQEGKRVKEKRVEVW